jgi:TatA/E family protein of Tat protein translocase
MGLGMPEVVLILVIALIVFGPRKLPELGKSLGQAMSQFRKASDDFKRTWEQEVETEKYRKTDSETANSGYNYNSTESNDPYNPYENDYYSNGSETPQLPAPEHENVANSSSSSQPDPAKAETVTAGAETPSASSATGPENKHWI